MLAVPVLAGSSAYALSEAAAWRGSLDMPPHGARRFYAVIAISVALGVALKLAGFSAVTLMFAAAVFNGILAPPLIVLLVLLTGSARVMCGQPEPPRPDVGRLDCRGPRLSPPWLASVAVSL